MYVADQSLRGIGKLAAEQEYIRTLRAQIKLLEMI